MQTVPLLSRCKCRAYGGISAALRYAFLPYAKPPLIHANFRKLDFQHPGK